jgi:acyl-CoA reductase-like NAD-dependent aldehyde dehydrogenase
MTARPNLNLEAPVAATVEAAVGRMHETFAAQRAAFAQDMNPSREVRADRMDRLARMTQRHQDAIAAAISADFGHRAREETDLAKSFWSCPQYAKQSAIWGVG